MPVCYFDGCGKELQPRNTSGSCPKHFNGSPKARETKRLYREANREALRAAGREYARKQMTESPEAVRDYHRAWRAAHPALVRQYSVEWRLANLDSERARQRAEYAAEPDKFKQRTRARRRTSPDAARAAEKAYRLRNPEKVSAKDANRRARMLRAEGTFTETEWWRLMEDYSFVCPCCGKDDVTLTVDHIIPLDWGGSNWITNCQPLCGPCNSAKGAHHATHYLPWGRQAP